MNYHVLTLFPEMILQGLNTSIIGRKEREYGSDVHAYFGRG